MIAALLVDDDHAVRVAIERDADVGAALHGLARMAPGAVEPHLVVDVEAVGLDADREHLGAELAQRFRRDLVGGAIGAIDDDLEPVEARSRRGSVALTIST